MDSVVHLNAAVGYIERRLFDAIDFTEAARLAACSEYQLRRMFSYLAGMPLNEYIRRRRLWQAAALLHPGAGRITDIAHKCGYESQDAFAKAFAVQFGMTPFAYRRKPVALPPFPPLVFRLTLLEGIAANERPTHKLLPMGQKEEEMIKLNSFTPVEKDACLPVVDLMVECANIARQHGVLALEDWVKTQESNYLKYLVLLMVDGTDPALVAEMGRSLLEADKHTGSGYLSRRLILEGVLGVQAGENPRILECKLLVMLGERYLLARGHMGGENTNPAPAYVAEGTPAQTALPGSEGFCAVFAKLENLDIQRVMREIDQKDLTVALKGCDTATFERFMQNLSKRLAEMIVEEMGWMGALRESDIYEAQERILQVYRRLADTGEIVAPE